MLEFVLVAAVAALALTAVHFFDHRPPRRRPSLIFELGFCVVLAMVVFQVVLPPSENTMLHHHDFFLGPVNDMAHGRTMLVEVWAQYGVGLYYALLALLKVLPLNHGVLVLVLSTLMTAQYLLVYTTLRMAIRSQALVIGAIVAAVLGNLFAPMGAYFAYPSVGPLRFGFPYLVIAAAVAAARWPRYARALRVGQLCLIAIAAVWSFETSVYTATTWFALTALLAFGPTRAGVRLLARELTAAAAVSIAAVLALTVGTRVASGRWPDWCGYLAYVRLYSVDEFGNLPVDFWSPPVLMAAGIFLSAAGVVS